MKVNSANSKTFSVRPTLPILAAVLFTASLLEGGTVFMKNGYIIQGPIVDRDHAVVVLGWDYGKVTIHQRFFESVVLEPEEEAALARRRAEEEEDAEGGGLEEDDFDYGQADYELPSDFQALAKDLRLFPGIDPLEAPSDGSFVPLEIPGLPEDPGGGTDSTVQIMDIPKGLGARVEDAELAFSIHPPMQWSREDGEGGRVQWTGPAQEDGFIPSLIIVSSEVSDWEPETAREAFKEEARSALPELEVIREGPVWIQDRETFQITGRAVIRRETDGAGEDVELSIRQILVPGAQRFWICTTFTSTTTDDEVLLVLERALQSLEFSASESADTGSTEPEPPSFPNDSGEEEEEN